MPDDTEKLVLEMGQDHLGDIHLLSELAHPKTAIVTLVGEAHLALFHPISDLQFPFGNFRTVFKDSYCDLDRRSSFSLL